MAERYWVWLDRAGFAVDVSDVPVPDPPDGWRRVEVMLVEDAVVAMVDAGLFRRPETVPTVLPAFPVMVPVDRAEARRILGLEDNDG